MKNKVKVYMLYAFKIAIFALIIYGLKFGF